MEIIKTLSFEERATWSECSICKAKHGEFCKSYIGLPLGLTVDGHPPKNGVHLARIDKAPFKVKLVPCD